jgi:hypothetical protein
MICIGYILAYCIYHIVRALFFQHTSLLHFVIKYITFRYDFARYHSYFSYVATLAHHFLLYRANFPIQQKNRVAASRPFIAKAAAPFALAENATRVS